MRLEGEGPHEVQGTIIYSPQPVTPITANRQSGAYIHDSGFSLEASDCAARRYAMSAFVQVSRLSLKNILFPTDFSPASHAALPFARALAQTYGSTILVAHAIAPEPHRQVVTD